MVFVDGDFGQPVGTRITLDKALLIGGRDFTLIGERKGELLTKLSEVVASAKFNVCVLI